MPAANNEEKGSNTGTIVFGILTGVFVITTGVMTYLFVSTRNELLQLEKITGYTFNQGRAVKSSTDTTAVA